MILHGDIRNGIRELFGSFHRRRIDAVFHHHRLERRSGEYRLTDDPLLPRNDVAGAVERCADRVVIKRPEIAGPRVVFARSDGTVGEEPFEFVASEAVIVSAVVPA